MSKKTWNVIGDFQIFEIDRQRLINFIKNDY